jgi:hypothetical protein
MIPSPSANICPEDRDCHQFIFNRTLIILIQNSEEGYQTYNLLYRGLKSYHGPWLKDPLEIINFRIVRFAANTTFLNQCQSWRFLGRMKLIRLAHLLNPLVSPFYRVKNNQKYIKYMLPTNASSHVSFPLDNVSRRLVTFLAQKRRYAAP